jgi:hypothetical protein
VRWTDRVFAFARLFGEDVLFPEAKPDVSRRPDLELLYATATGDRGSFLVFPMNAVRWHTEPREVAALVTNRGRDRSRREAPWSARPTQAGAKRAGIILARLRKASTD